MITARELAAPDLLNCSLDKVYRMARKGEIPAVKVGTEYRFDWDEVKTALTAKHVDPWVNPRARRRRSS